MAFSSLWITGKCTLIPKNAEVAKSFITSCIFIFLWPLNSFVFQAELWTVNRRYWYLLVSSVITAWSSVILQSLKFILCVIINILKGILGLIIIVCDCFKNSNDYIFIQFSREMIISIHFTIGRIRHRKKHDYVCVCTCVCTFKTDLGNFSLTFPKNYFTDCTNFTATISKTLWCCFKLTTFLCCPTKILTVLKLKPMSIKRWYRDTREICQWKILILLKWKALAFFFFFFKVHCVAWTKSPELLIFYLNYDRV